MSTVSKAENPEENPRVEAVFEDIMHTRGTSFVGNIWRYLAFDPSLLESVWKDVKRLMTGNTLLDPKTKEMIYVAVSIANSCSYCIHSHTAAARAQGMSDAEHAELLDIISLAARTNHLLNGLQVPVDDVFDKSVSN
ncbi:MAG: carboxymuconolactone decarboxylase family protein [Granulosicoccus sp.]